MWDTVTDERREVLHKTMEASQDTQRRIKGLTDEAECCMLQSTAQAGRGSKHKACVQQAASPTGRQVQGNGHVVQSNRQTVQQEATSTGSQFNRQAVQQVGRQTVPLADCQARGGNTGWIDRVTPQVGGTPGKQGENNSTAHLPAPPPLPLLCCSTCSSSTMLCSSPPLTHLPHLVTHSHNHVLPLPCTLRHTVHSQTARVVHIL